MHSGQVSPSEPTAPTDVAPELDSPGSGHLIADRYRLRRRLGRGGHGEVWEGEDLLRRRTIAIKLYHRQLPMDPARVQREILALRILRLPGVVRLLDEGMEGQRPFLIMERVEGTPFPGEGRSGRWTAIAETTIALLETIARIHAAGVVHRDLKPENVLVHADGRPTVLDFGISSGHRLGTALTEQGWILGTPAYLAPEQILGEPVTAATDLYALGLLLYEALAGRLPHPASDRDALLRARIAERAPPLKCRAPEVPTMVAGLVDLLLSREAEARPRSAAEVLGILRGQPIAHLTDPMLPRLDGDAPVQALLHSARARRSADLVGPRHTGRTRCLRDVAEALEAEGHRVAWTVPGSRVFASLEPAIGALGARLGCLAEAIEMVDARLQAALAGGLVLLADDAEHLDRWSAAAIERCRSSGAVLRALVQAQGSTDGTAIVKLDPLEESALEALFSGPERIFHLRSDAARVLWARTEGLQARIAEEVTAWLRAGIARWDGSTLALDRDTLDRLESGLRVVLPDRSRWTEVETAAKEPLPAHLEELAAWISVAGTAASPDVLGAAMGLPAWRVEADIQELALRGAVRPLPSGRVDVRSSTAADQQWSPERRRFVHRTIAAALAEGAPDRLRHLLAGAGGAGATSADTLEIAREAEALARRLAHDGRTGQIIAALEEGLSFVQRSAAPEARRAAIGERLLALWVEVALSEGTPQAHARALYELCRTERRTAAIAHLEQLVRAAVALEAGGERALTLLHAIAPFEDPDLERHRQGLRILAARQCSQAMEEATLDEIALWVSRSGDATSEARLAGWLARLRCRQGRFEEAARLYAEAARREPWTTARIAARLNGASALMEAFRHREAAEEAQVARKQAEDCGHPLYEARAEWLLRRAAYRDGSTTRPDLELVEATSRLGVSDLEASVCSTEAAVAYRAGERRCAIDLAARSLAVAHSIHDAWPAMLIRCLALASGAPPKDAGEIQELARRAMECDVPGVGVQALGLLSLSLGTAPPAWKKMALALTAGIPASCWHLRMDILSVDEVLDAVAGAARRRRA